MTEDLYFPQTLHEAMKHFADPNEAHQFFVTLRWPGGVTCPYCRGTEHSFIRTRKTWACKECKKRFTVKVGTIMEDSPLRIETWFAAMRLLGNAKNDISS